MLQTIQETRTTATYTKIFCDPSSEVRELSCIFFKHRVSVGFKPQNTLHQKLFHPKDRVLYFINKSVSIFFM